MPYRLVERHEWTEIPSPKTMAPLPGPVDVVFFGYTNKDYTAVRAKHSPGSRPDHEETKRELRYLLKGDMYKMPDIRYNFLIGNDGNIYEGRGWKYRPWLPVRYFAQKVIFNKSIFITFIGDFKNATPPDNMFQMREEFLIDSIKNNRLQRKFIYVGMGNVPGMSTNLQHFL